MKSFRYRLHAVLVLRQRVEQAAMQAYAQALSSQSLASQRLEAAKQDRVSARRNWTQSVKKRVSIATVRSAWLLYAMAQQQVQTVEKDYTRFLDRAAQAKDRMMQARRWKDSVEAHRERCRLVHECDQERATRRLIDDLVSQRFARGRSPGETASAPKTRIG